MKIKLLFLCFWVLMIFGCKKEADNLSTTPTNAMFWVNNDFGCGPITVSLNGTDKVINGYYASQPSCGANNTATFDLSEGYYNFTANCSSKTWSGSITVDKAKCNAFQLLSSGGVNGGTTPTLTTPSTQFLASQDYSVNNIGDYWVQQFTITQQTSFDFRFASMYQSQASIILPTQLSNFQNNLSFSGYSLFDKTIGTHHFTLNAGTYYLAVRNASSGSNKWSVELDYSITLPTSDKAVFYDYYISDNKAFTAGTKFWQPFKIQTGFRYFMDGCNVNCDLNIIPASQLPAFQNNQTFQYYSDYSDNTGNGPGLYEIKLSAGDYYLISSNADVAALTYVMERWKVN